jgi:DNA-binding transcriptional regulator YiaG
MNPKPHPLVLRLRYLNGEQETLDLLKQKLNGQMAAKAKTIRLDARLKISTVATALGVSTSQLSKLENGEARWTEDLFTRILYLQ